MVYCRIKICCSKKVVLNQIISGFEYETFFESKIDEKKKDQSYRIFNKINRLAKDFPLGESYSHGKDGDTISVWCSNDYLGIGHHPAVMQSVR